MSETSTPNISIPEDELSQWYYIDRGGKNGPFTTSKMENLIRSKDIEFDTKVWKRGSTDWISLKDSELVNLLGDSPPPINGDSIDNTIVWILAFTPIILALIRYFLLLQIIGGGVHPSVGLKILPYILNGIPWEVILLTNWVLLALDERNVRQAGYSMKWAVFLAGLLLPVYLFLRAKRLKQRPYYAITWIVMLLIATMYLSPNLE